jgi:uncharacterized metal-binding protein
MENNSCLYSIESSIKNYELVKIEKTKKYCSLCEEYAEGQLNDKVPYAILSCEGACLRGEVSRQVANNICYSEIPEKTSRICLGGAFTKNTGQRNLVRNAQRVIVLEGCSIKCASRMMKGVLSGLDPEVFLIDRYYDFDRKLFGIDEVTEQEIKQFAHAATNKIVVKINTDK